MDGNYLLNFLEEKNELLVTKKKHTFIAYYGLDQEFTFVLKDGIIKNSIIQWDGREFNIAYVKSPSITSLLKDEISNKTSSPFTVRVETETATFYKIPRVKFWNYINSDEKLQTYVNHYYRDSLHKAIRRQRIMTMNGKTGAVCGFLYDMVKDFGLEQKNGIYLIDFPITNEDIAGFCGISSRNSVNRILHQLQKEKAILLKNQKIYVTDLDYLEYYVQE